MTDCAPPHDLNGVGYAHVRALVHGRDLLQQHAPPLGLALHVSIILSTQASNICVAPHYTQYPWPDIALKFPRTSLTRNYDEGLGTR